jgi:hypothetical protein
MVEKNLIWFTDQRGESVQELFSGELLLREHILPDLDLGRVNFDRPHTGGVVFWIKELLQDYPQLNAKILITAAYAHDWGYRGLFGSGASDDLDLIHDKKEAHMQIGAEKIGELLRSKQFEGLYTEEEIEQIQGLVLVHDRIEQLTTDEELLLMEADTLGMLDTDFVKPTFTAEDSAVFIEREINNRRRPAFKHEKAIKVFGEVLQKHLSFYLAKKSD